MICGLNQFTVSRELSSSDKDILAKDGVKLPRNAERVSRKRLQQKTLETDTSSMSSPSQQGASASGHSGKTTEPKWEELKNYLDPNPQLKGWDKGKLLPKVRTLTNIIIIVP